MRLVAPKFWYKNSFIAYLLLPFSLLYCTIVMLRRLLYKIGICKTYNFDVPIIVVGNLTVGGTGKTPLVCYLVQLLKEAGYKPGIVSRGYGGTASHYSHIVTKTDDAVTVGDEALILFAVAPLAIAPKRVLAVKKLLEASSCDVVICDDGLQHCSLSRDIELVVIDGERQFGNGFCLPAGPMREPKWRLSTVDFVISRGEKISQAQYTMQIVPSKAFISVKDGAAHRDVELFTGKTVHAVAGIANPEQFFSLLGRLGIHVIRHAFPDHYQFQTDDIKFVDDLPIIMTEKDAVKCRMFADDACWYLPIKVEIAREFNAALLKKLL